MKVAHQEEHVSSCDGATWVAKLKNILSVDPGGPGGDVKSPPGRSEHGCEI